MTASAADALAAAGVAAPWTRTDRALLGALVALCALSLPWLVHPWYEAGAGSSDAALYLLCAKSLLAGEGYAYLGEPFTVRPPGMSLLVAPWIAARGLDHRVLNLFVASFGVAAAALYFALLRPRTGGWVAAAASLALFLNPGFRRMSNEVMSDVPGLALALGCLLLERRARRAPTWANEAALGLAIGASVYVRSVLVLLVPAIVGARVLARTREGGGLAAWRSFALRRLAPVAVLPALALLPWAVRDAANAPRGAVDQNFIHGYSTAMWNVDPGDPSSPRRSPAEVLERAPTRGRQVLSLLGSRMRTSQGGAGAVAAGAAATALALALAARRRRASDLYLLLLLAVVAVYFAFQDRLALPVFALALAALAELAALGGARLAGAARGRALAAAALLALAALDFRPRERWDEIEKLHALHGRLGAELSARIEPDARVASAIGWHLSLYLDRPVWSLLFAVRRAKQDSAVEAVIDEHAIDTVVLTELSEAERALLPWFRGRYPEVRVGPASVFRVRGG